MVSKKVVFVHRVTCDYSESFLREVHEKLREFNIDFQVVSGQPWKSEALTDVVSNLPFGHSCFNKKLIGPFYWSSGVLSHIKNADLVIMEQLNSAVHNYLMLLFSHSKPGFAFKKYKFRTAYYGHGLNLNSQTVQLRNWWKRTMISWVDWWFAYTDITKKIIRSNGYSKGITIMNNTVDTTLLEAEITKYTKEDLAKFYNEFFNTSEHHPTAVFCGRLVELKWIPFLLQALDLIKKSLPEFRAIIIGSGPYSKQVEEFCKGRHWCKYTGSKTGAAKVKYLLLGDVWLNPGGLGLAVVDAFALGLPLITTDNNIHGPEIAYLEHGKNGMITEPEVNHFANSVVTLLQDQTLLNSLNKGSYESSKKYSIDNMVNNFVDGVLRCLKMKENEHVAIGK